MPKVALVRCGSYEYDEVREAVAKGIGLLGGAGQFAKKEEKILLKPNMLAADPPERCSTTHFSVFKAVAEVFMQTGADLSYGDAPAVHKPLTAARKCKIAEAADSLGVRLADFENGEMALFEEGMQNKKFFIAKGVLESEGIVSLPKLKTHGYARMTGCVKNQFGYIPGTLKGEFHVRLPDANEFAKMLVDINRYKKPRLYIMDGIMAMEGNGPRGGNPKPMNVLIFSSDPIALDSVVCRMIQLEPEFVPTIKYGMEAGLGTYKESDIEIVGDPLEAFIQQDFNVTREPIAPYKPGKGIQLLRNMLVPKPYIKSEKCVRCGVCVQMCPVNPKAVDWNEGKKNQVPSYQYKHCIRCYCCQELCPESAIHLKVPLVRRFVARKKF